MIKVYKYELHPPTTNASVVHEQLRLAHEYRKKLVEISRRERSELRAVQLTHGSIPQLAAAAKEADAVCEAAYEAIKRFKGKERTRKVPDLLRTAHAEAKQKKFEASRALSTARAALRDDASITVRRDEIVERYKEERKRARAACGVYWGTYLGIEAADGQANKTTPLWNGTEPLDPRWPPFDGGGALAVQIQAGLSPDKLVDGTSRHARVVAAALPPGADPTSKKSAKKADYYKTLSMRISSTPEGEPIWGEWRMIMHRPLPKDAVIKWVSVKMRRVGPWERWYACFTVEMPAPVRLTATPHRVAVDVGWRVVDDGIRVATWRAEDGENGFLVVTHHLLGGFRKVEDLRSIRDKNFDRARVELLAALPSERPEWFPTTIPQWKSIKRMVSLRHRWSQQRFAGDEVAFEIVNAWAKQDRHLWEWESGQRERNFRVRTMLYRKFAAQLAKKYTRLVIDDYDISEMARRPSAEAQQGDIPAARSNRVVVATGDLRECLVKAFRTDVDKAPTEFSTRTCATCASVEEWDQARQIEHTCSKCGSHWDQDQNKTRNLLAYQVPPPKEEAPAGPQESRWQKARRQHGERKQRLQASTEAAE